MLLRKKLRFNKNKKKSSSSEKTASSKAVPAPARRGVFRRASLTSQPWLKKEENEATEATPSIQQGITWTMSEDEEHTTTSSKSIQPVAVKKITMDSTAKQETKRKITIERTLTFTEKEVMQNQLYHMRQLIAKDQEIAQKQQVNQEMRQQFNKTLAELKEQHSNEMDAAEMELVMTQCELEQTKEEMVQVSGVLMQTQNELFEATQAKSWTNVFSKGIEVFTS